MIFFQNRLITLAYWQGLDILIVTWSDMDTYDLPEVQQSLDKVIESIRSYKCRKLLVDASMANLSVEDAAFRTILTNFISEVSRSGIKKLARIITNDPVRELRIQAIEAGLTIPFQVYDISNREQAIKWLEEG